MNIFRISAIGAIAMMLLAGGSALAQSQGGGENYYSNPKIGKKATFPSSYSDQTVVAKSEDLKIEIQGEVGDSITDKDSVQGSFDPEGYYDYEYSARINRFHRNMGWNYYDDYYTNSYWYNGDPWLWGSSIYWGPYWGWNGYWSPYWHSGWALSYGWDYYPYGWGWGPHWGCTWYLGNGWSMGWGYDPFWDPYWGYGWHDPYYGGFGGHGVAGMQGFGHQYLGDMAGRRNLTNPTSRESNPTPTRRGGVDLNSNGRPTPGNLGRADATHSGTSSRTPVSGATRYSRPENMTNNRQALSSRNTNGRSAYTSPSSSSRTSQSGYRTGESSRPESSRSTYTSSSSSSFGSSSSRSSSISTGSSSSRSTYSGGSSSRGSSYSGGSSSRGSYSGGSSHSSGGGHSSSGGGHSSSGGHR